MGWLPCPECCSRGIQALQKGQEEKRRGGRFAHYVSVHLCMELCLGMEKDPMESLWVRIKEKTGKGDSIVGVCYRHSTGKNKWMRPSIDK